MMLRSISYTLALLLLMTAGAGPLAPAAEGAASDRDLADAIILDVKDTYTLNEDGGISHRRESKTRLLTKYAFHRLLGETFIVYNPRFQDLAIHRAVTTMADGKEVPCSDNAFNEVLPGFCQMAAPYGHLREMVVTHLGLERGAVIHIDYEVVSKPGFYPYLMGSELFSAPYPIDRKTVVVRIPRGTELKVQFAHLPDAAPVKAEDGGFDTYTWSLTDLTMAPPEAGAQDGEDYAPYLLFSSCPSWIEAAEALDALIIPAIQLDEKALAKSLELKRKAGNPMDLARSINRFVVEELAGAAVDSTYLAYMPIGSEAVLQANVGNNLDRAILLAGMLRAAGFRSEPVLVSRNMAVAESVPSWIQFGECRVMCTLRDDPELIAYLSPDRLVAGCFDGLEGRTLFFPGGKDGPDILKQIPRLTSTANAVKADLHLTLDDAHRLSGDLAIEVSGALNPYLSLTENSESWAVGRFKRLLPGGDVKDVKPTLLSPERSAFNAVIKSPIALEKKHGLITLTVSSVPGGAQDMHIPVAGKHRTTPLAMARAISEEISIDINVPENVEVLNLPDPIARSNSAGKIECRAWLDQGVLRVRRRLELNGTPVSPANFADLKALVVEWTADDARRLVLKVDKG